MTITVLEKNINRKIIQTNKFNVDYYSHLTRTI